MRWFISKKNLFWSLPFFLQSAAATACPYCYSYTRGGLKSYFAATLLLILLPLTLLAAIGWYILRVVKKT